MVATGRAEVMLDPAVSIWDVAPFPPIFGGGRLLRVMDGEEGHTHGEGLACNAALKPRVLELTRSQT